jgi:hypothetical protein
MLFSSKRGEDGRRGGGGEGSGGGRGQIIEWDWVYYLLWLSPHYHTVALERQPSKIPKNTIAAEN